MVPLAIALAVHRLRYGTDFTQGHEALPLGQSHHNYPNAHLGEILERTDIL